MKYSVVLGDSVTVVEIRDEAGCRKVFWEGKLVDVDCILDRSNPMASLIVDGHPYEAEVKRDGEDFFIDFGQRVHSVRVSRGLLRGGRVEVLKHGIGQETISAPMPGMVVALKVSEGQEVKIGEPLLILEAMKMENEIRSPVQGRIQRLFAEKGRKVEKNEKLLVIDKCLLSLKD